MYERFTHRAQRVMQLAHQEAQRLNHEYIGTEHILLGLAKEGSGVAADILLHFHADPERIRIETNKIVQCGPVDICISAKLRQTPLAKKILEFALEEVAALHDSRVGTEHILLGILRAQECVAAQVLMNLGLKIKDLREAVLDLLDPHRQKPVPENRHLARMKHLLARPYMTDDELLAVFEGVLYDIESLWRALSITHLPHRPTDPYEFFGPEFRATGPHSDLPT